MTGTGTSEQRLDAFEDRLIFVGGAPRSGTTLVQNMLDCHPLILGAPEFLHLPDIVSLRETALKSLSAHGRDPSYVDEQVRGLILAFFLPLWKREGTRYLSEKTPENVLVFDALAELFPSSRFIFVVRDPRATVASMLEVARRARERGMRPASFTRTLAAATEHARRCMLAGFRAASARPDQVRIVVYEELVASSEEQSRGLCDFLGMEWTAEMLDPAAKRHLGEDAITRQSDEIWYHQSNFARNPDPSRIEKWRDQLSDREQRFIARAFLEFPELDALGYWNRYD